MSDSGCLRQNPQRTLAASALVLRACVALADSAEMGAPAPDAPKDKRFADPDWTANPVFALIRQTYGLLTEQLLTTTRTMAGLDDHARAKMEFAARNMAEALSPRCTL